MQIEGKEERLTREEIQSLPRDQRQALEALTTRDGQATGQFERESVFTRAKRWLTEEASNVITTMAGTAAAVNAAASIPPQQIPLPASAYSEGGVTPVQQIRGRNDTTAEQPVETAAPTLPAVYSHAELVARCRAARVAGYEAALREQEAADAAHAFGQANRDTIPTGGYIRPENIGIMPEGQGEQLNDPRIIGQPATRPASAQADRVFPRAPRSAPFPRPLRPVFGYEQSCEPAHGPYHVRLPDSIPNFNGSVNENVAAWVRMVDAQMALYGWTAQQELQAAAARLTGFANTWFVTLMTQGRPPSSWDQLRESLLNHYARTDLFEEARRKMEALYCVAGKEDVFIQRFQELEVILREHLGEEVLFLDFRQRVTNEVARYELYANRERYTLESAYQLVLRHAEADRQFRRPQSDRKEPRRNYVQNYPKQPAAPIATTATTAAAAAAAARPPVMPGLSCFRCQGPHLIAQCPLPENRACFHCGRIGHTASRCNQKQRTGANQVPLGRNRQLALIEEHSITPADLDEIIARKMQAAEIREQSGNADNQ